MPKPMRVYKADIRAEMQQKELDELRGKLAAAEQARDRWKQIATDMREERDQARLNLERVGQMMGGMG